MTLTLNGREKRSSLFCQCTNDEEKRLYDAGPRFMLTKVLERPFDSSEKDLESSEITPMMDPVQVSMLVNFFSGEKVK